jgi:hypothetical protein
MTSITIYYLIKKLAPGGRMTFDPSIREFLTAARLGVVSGVYRVYDFAAFRLPWSVLCFLLPGHSSWSSNR